MDDLRLDLDPVLLGGAPLAWAQEQTADQTPTLEGLYAMLDPLQRRSAFLYEKASK